MAVEFCGEIDGVYYYPRELTPEEIAALAADTIRPSELGGVLVPDSTPHLYTEVYDGIQSRRVVYANGRAIEAAFATRTR